MSDKKHTIIVEDAAKMAEWISSDHQPGCPAGEAQKKLRPLLEALETRHRAQCAKRLNQAGLASVNDQSSAPEKSAADDIIRSCVSNLVIERSLLIGQYANWLMRCTCPLVAKVKDEK